MRKELVRIRSAQIRFDPIRSDPIRSYPIRSDPFRSIRSDKAQIILALQKNSVVPDNDPRHRGNIIWHLLQDQNVFSAQGGSEGGGKVFFEANSARGLAAHNSRNLNRYKRGEVRNKSNVNDQKDVNTNR